LDKYLGSKKYRYDVLSQKSELGLATGLAWTTVGGVTLTIEATLMSGKGEIILTGQLGDVMKESAQAGISYIRSKAEELGIDKDFHEKMDVHIHIPEGAIPKDGPSAGITMATAVISALTGKPINREVAMTGEITLRGRVLPIGGLKEKSLAAARAVITKILIPKENEKDLDDIPAIIKRKVKFVPVESMDEVLEHALMDGEQK
jgi:ATP-dependent Lon protease